jgi:uncharacterized protein YxjI
MKLQKIIFTKILIPVIFFYAIDLYGLNSAITSKNQSELEIILDKCAEYCERLSNIALYFICREKIREEVSQAISFSPSHFKVNRRQFYSSQQKKYFTYVYDYQLIRKDGRIQEQRILLEENSRAKHIKNAQLKTQLFYHRNLIFSPTDFLSKSRQPFFNYKIEGGKQSKGQRILIIEAVPKPLQNVTHLSGKIWVDRDTFNIVRIEWEQSSLKNIKRIEIMAKKLRAKPQITITTDFAIEKNGIHFPSKHFVREEYIRSGGRYVSSETTVHYENYKFFTVYVDVKD